MKWKRPVRQRQVSSGEKQPDLSRKIYSACHRFYFRVYLKTVNTPEQRVFSACCALFSLAIHKVFLRENGISILFLEKMVNTILSCEYFAGRL